MHDRSPQSAAAWFSPICSLGPIYIIDFQFCMFRNADVEEQIAHLRAELLHKEQENERVQLQLVKEKEERERAERQAGH